MKLISKFYLWSAGYTIKGVFPKEIKKCIVVAAPHTSNMDFIIGRAAFYVLGINKIKFMIKKEFFIFPLGGPLKAMGGWPVDRKANTMIKDSISEFAKKESFYLLVTPEGTRKLVKNWKKGFYFIADGAKVPIVLTYIDYAKKEGGVGPIFYPSGNYDEDFKIIAEFYKDKTAKFPENFNLSPMYRNDNQ